MIDLIERLNLNQKPYRLSDEDIRWVKETWEEMTQKEKVGHLFCINVMENNVEPLLERLDACGLTPGSFMSRAFPAAEVYDIFSTLQNAYDIPLLLAANIERGADGVCREGTCFGTQMQIAAANDEDISYQCGYLSGKEALALGCNWNFGPILDIDFNFHNPITNTRAFSADPEKVLRMAKGYVKGMRDAGMAVTLKHWPGDGRDERDQHMAVTVNDMTTEQWDETYGRIYEELIQQGAESVMSAHITLPSYSRKLRDGIKDKEIMPGSLSHELNNDLLRERLGFNGLIVSDATTMNGFMQAMSREKAVPQCVASGCDIFLFTCNMEEDFAFMLKGVEEGVISQERLDEAVLRILALKACLGLHVKKSENRLIPEKSGLSIIGCEAHRKEAARYADRAVTLVRDTQRLLPIFVEEHKRVLLHVLGDVGGYHDPTKDHAKYFAERMEQEGFDLIRFDPSDTTMHYTNISVEELKKKFDIIIYFANIKTSGSDTVARIKWTAPGASNSPRYIHDIPTLFISVDNPYHLMDVPAVKTFINGYTPSEFVIDSIVEKILGKSRFCGENPVDPFCGPSFNPIIGAQRR